MSISVSVDTTRLQNILNGLKQNRDEAIRSTALYTLGEARKKAPRKTGWLRENSGIKQWDNFVNVEFYAEYAPYQELGTSKMAAHPFLTPAVEKATDKLIKNIKRELIK